MRQLTEFLSDHAWSAAEIIDLSLDAAAMTRYWLQSIEESTL